MRILRGFDDCECGSRTFVARVGTQTSTVLDAAGEAVDRTSSDSVEDVECAVCGRVVRNSTELAPEEADALLDPDGGPSLAPGSPGAEHHARRSAAMDDTAEAGAGKRLALLVAALLWDNEEHYGDIYDRRVAEAGEPSPNLRLVELTEDGRVEILADGREYVVRVEPKAR